jgi:4'-phosphopantetheinyl transferase
LRRGYDSTLPDTSFRDEAGGMFVDVWAISLRPDDLACDAVLSEEERRRAARFRFPQHAMRYRMCHSAMRRVLGAYLAMPPEKVELTYESKGKPRLACDSKLCFNLSHSGDLGLLAVTEGREVGVDVETVRFDLPVDGLAKFFTLVERETLRALSSGEKERTFFRWWTRKEAVLKAEGSGLSGGLDRLDISNCPPDLVRFLDEGQWWRVEDLEVESGYAAAVAATAGEWEVRWRRLEA